MRLGYRRLSDVEGLSPQEIVRRVKSLASEVYTLRKQLRELRAERKRLKEALAQHGVPVTRAATYHPAGTWPAVERRRAERRSGANRRSGPERGRAGAAPPQEQE